MKKILLELSDELASQVDSRRGNQPRVAWIRDAITERLNVPCETIHKPDNLTEELRRVVTHGASFDIPAQPDIGFIPAKPTVEALRAKIPESSRPRMTTYPKSRERCDHYYRNPSGYCPTCGDQR